MWKCRRLPAFCWRWRYHRQVETPALQISLRPGFEAVDDPRNVPGAVHPIIRTHNETGRKVLYLGRREWTYVPGLSLDESEKLLDELWQYAALTANVWPQTWQPDDLIIWDNRRVLHRR